MKKGEMDGNQGDSFLFQHLVAMFQTLALQQLGKLMNPITGKVERDLNQARITIDMIAMIQRKTDGNLTEEEKRIIDAVLMDLQMNYVDEKSRRDVDEDEAAREQDKTDAGNE